MVAQDIDFEELTIELKKLKNQPKIVDEDPTYFEITGYPYLENVASNILGFFLDPNEAHGFGTLFLESFLSVIKENSSVEDFLEVEVERESYTDKNCRIDIVVKTNNLSLAIENKIYAKLNNDLSHYFDHLRKMSQGRRVFGFLLTLKPMTVPSSAKGFVNVTYENLFTELLNNSGKELLNINNRYFSLFIEFIKTKKT